MAVHSSAPLWLPAHRVLNCTGTGGHSTMAHERIEMNPEIMGGKPVVRGTRIPVELGLRKLGAGMTPEAILTGHPRLTPDENPAAQAFTADYFAGEQLSYR